jgi:hypothetical protein
MGWATVDAESQPAERLSRGAFAMTVKMILRTMPPVRGLHRHARLWDFILADHRSDLISPMRGETERRLREAILPSQTVSGEGMLEQATHRELSLIFSHVCLWEKVPSSKNP